MGFRFLLTLWLGFWIIVLIVDWKSFENWLVYVIEIVLPVYSILWLAVLLLVISVLIKFILIVHLKNLSIL